MMKVAVLVFCLSLVPTSLSLCMIQSCNKWWTGGARTDPKITGACAVMFDENCCKSSKTFHVVQRGEEGKLCGTVSRMNPFSSCVGPRLKDDIESLEVMPGCTLEVWDHGSGLKNAKAEKRKKLVFSAFQNIQIVEEINDDFDDMDEDIESYRCRCNQGNRPIGE